MTTSTLTELVRRGDWQRRLGFSLSSGVTVGLLIAVTVLNAAIQPTFFTTYSITSTFATFTPAVLAAIAAAIVIIGGGLDLSIGSIVALASVSAVVVMNGDPARAGLGIVTSILVGAACGFVNGLVVGVVRLQPLIATFATSSVFAGAALVVLPTPGGLVPSVITDSYRSAVAGVPVPVLLVLGAVGLYLVFSRTQLMRHIRAVGGDRAAAFASLVPVVRVQIASYVVAGVLAGLAAAAVVANTGSGDPFVGSSMAMDSIAAVVLGGIALSGGSGSAVGAVAGALILGIVSNVLSFLGIPTTWRQLTSGLVIIVALALSVLTSRRVQR
ncbi:MAG: ABC transporter permease [Cellulomonadaceae bacterium]|nr:ABC transporter permease [Cellulomonadaceae bacterium]